MDFFRNRFYSINAILLTSVGQWPYHSSKWKNFQQIIFHAIIISVMTVQAIKMIEIWGDVDIMIECFTPMSVQLAACTKSFNCMINHHKMKKLLDCMQRDWSSLTNEREIEILEKFAKSGRNLTLTYAVFLLGSMSMYLLIPMMPQILDVILPLNESRQRTYLYQTEYFIDSEKYFYSIAFHTYTGTIIEISTIVAVDGMYATYVQHVCGLLAVLSYRFERTIDGINLKFDANIEIENDTNYRELIDCIKKHQDAIKFAVLIESTYSRSFLLQMGISMTLISVSLLQLLTKFGQYEEMYRLIQFISAQMFHLFFNSWPGQKLIDQSDDFRDSIYHAGWYGFSLRSRNLIKMVMLGAAAPLKITANGLYEMSMENFGSVVQTSISYFTVLASLR